MKYLDKRRLLRLLSSSRDLPFSSDFTGIENYVVTSPIIGHELVDIYTRRFETAGNKYEGFSELLNTLPKFAKKKVKVHSFELNNKQIFLFTDPYTKVVLGVLVEHGRLG